MRTNLTLTLSKSVIDRAKKYAQKENKSLSELLEDYFSKLTEESMPTQEITPLVKRLSGVVNKYSINDKNKYADFLSIKYHR